MPVLAKSSFFMTTSQNVRSFSYHKSARLFIKIHVENVEKSVYKSISRKNMYHSIVDNYFLLFTKKAESSCLFVQDSQITPHHIPHILF